jgi:hypothetical protein
MLVGQDWASSKWLSNPKNLIFSVLGQNPNLITNKNLKEYLKYFGLNFSDTYATNAFVFVKEGGMSTKIAQSLLRESIEKFLIPQIDIIKPKMIICLGAETYNAVRQVNNFPEVKVGSGQEAAMPFMGADVYGVNHTDYNPDDVAIFSAASCTTNAITPVLKVVEDTLGVAKGHIETIHAYTNDQNLVDNMHKKYRRGRAAALNMVITETGAGTAVAKALPSLAGKLNSNAIRVPVPNGSLVVMNL